MGEILKVLGQVTPVANTLTELYTVPSSFSSVISSITACNQNPSTTAFFRVSIAINGASDSPAQYLYYDLPLLNNDTFIATVGLSLAAGDVVRVQSNTSNISFNLLGIEVGAFGPPPENLAGGDLDGYYPNPTVVALQTNLVYPQALTYYDDGYVLTWDGIDGYWEALPSPIAGVILDEGLPNNLIANRSIQQSPIDNTQSGIVNLGSDTSGTSTGATANFATITGGDQNQNACQYGIVSGFDNQITTGTYSSAISGGGSNAIGASYASIGGGTSNTVNNAWGAIGGGENNSVYGNYGSIAGGFQNVAYSEGGIAGGTGNSASGPSLAGGFYSSASGTGAIALGWDTSCQSSASMTVGYFSTTTRFGQFSLSSCGGNLGGGQGDSQNGNLVYSNQLVPPATSIVLTDANAPQAEFGLSANKYYSINVRINAYAANAAVGPATWVYELSAYTVGGVAVIAGTPQQIITTPDPNSTTWTSSISVDGTTNVIHVNIGNGTDTTNTINAVADIRWVEMLGFSQ